MKCGSDWIRCDLHIHSPASFYHHYGDRNAPEVWERFLRELESLPIEFKIIGINDYLTIEGYKRVLTEKQKGRLSNIECILPVVEFRLSRLVGEGATKRLNYHVIFSDSIAPDTIQQQFLNALGATYQLEAGQRHPDWSAILSEDSLKELGRLIKAQSPGVASLQAKSDWEAGFDNFNVDYEKLQGILKFTPFRDRVIVAIGKSEWEEYRWDGGGAADKRTIINQTDIVFVAAESVTRFEGSRNSLRTANVNTLLLDCSDAHFFSDSTQKDRIGNCHTWIKAEPSFDGLRQILFEPEGRLSISETNPDKKAPYQVISYVRFVGGGEKFGNQEVRLSPYLTSIVGGKSTGKSLLAGLIVKSTDTQEYRKRTQSRADSRDPLAWVERDLPAMNFEVIWRDGETTTLKNLQKQRKVTYFPQHYLNSSINDQGVGNKDLNKIIRSVLSQNENYARAFDTYRQELQSLNIEVAAAATGFENTLRDLREARQQAAEKGKSLDILANIDELQIEFAELKKSFDLTEDEIRSHTQLSAELEALRAQKKILSTEIEILATIEPKYLAAKVSPSTLLPDLFEIASKDLAAEISAAVSSLFESFQNELLRALEPIKSARKERLTVVEADITRAGNQLEPILTKITSSAPLRELAEVIGTEKEKLEVALQLETKIAILERRVEEFVSGMTAFIDKRLALAAQVSSVIDEQPNQRGDEQLKIEIEPLVKSQHVQALLSERVKYQSNGAIRTIVQDTTMKDADFPTYRTAIATIAQQAATGVLEFKGGHKVAGLLQELLGNSIYLNYDLKFSGDSFTIMSPGKRALALLRIIVEMDSSEHPIILDQPEDDLDNRSIYDGLATYLKDKKQTRQIIVVTHSPNVVVGGDSEYVVVANQSGQESNRDNEYYRFEYVYGGLERSYIDPSQHWILRRQGVREHVCEILDGGKGAFERREKLYSTLKTQP